MSETFDVGDIAIVNKPESRWHGSEVRVEGPLEMVTIQYDTTREVVTALAHRLSGPWPEHWSYWGEPRYLIKKRPPRVELGRWDECPWQPASEMV